ncbi:unnamed protein product [Protopolystoma xenopodis]|uniref:Uncharacterized protein n=1 Tax=Protopolystoma xenopodis TaxID=117903 RepID=A0A3S5FD80_9PLAT|nr:unnamed protein product [Protopolystoma xenopodis]
MGSIKPKTANQPPVSPALLLAVSLAIWTVFPLFNFSRSPSPPCPTLPGQAWHMPCLSRPWSEIGAGPTMLPRRQNANRQPAISQPSKLFTVLSGWRPFCC